MVYYFETVEVEVVAEFGFRMGYVLAVAAVEVVAEIEFRMG